MSQRPVSLNILVLRNLQSLDELEEEERREKESRLAEVHRLQEEVLEVEVCKLAVTSLTGVLWTF
jgi:hypothetical protein